MLQDEPRLNFGSQVNPATNQSASEAGSKQIDAYENRDREFPRTADDEGLCTAQDSAYHEAIVASPPSDTNGCIATVDTDGRDKRKASSSLKLHHRSAFSTAFLIRSILLGKW